MDSPNRLARFALITSLVSSLSLLTFVPKADGEQNGQAEAIFEWRPARRHALIVVGLPGDELHGIAFQQTLNTWRQWLTEIAGVDRHDITLLSAVDEGGTGLPPTSNNIAEAIGRLRESIGGEDGLWVFILGHGSQDGRQGFFHLPGPDLSSTQWAGLLADCKATEQVFWLTQAGSGSFLKPMSLPGRVVITATDTEGEVNETKFPRMLAEIMQAQLDARDDDSKQNSPNDVLELFRATAEKVRHDYDSQQLVPTEHAQLDDNGDGLGTELGDLSPQTEPSESAQPLVDGVRAKRTVIRLRATPDQAAFPSTGDAPLPSLPDQVSE